MTDPELLQGFQACTLEAGAFRHRDHVRVIWLYLQREPIGPALARFSAGLRRFAAAAGRPHLYHETITCAYAFLVNERMERTGRQSSWDEFAASNADLLTWRPSILDRLYRPATLQSELARRVFVLPDGATAGARPETAEAAAALG